MSLTDFTNGHSEHPVLVDVVQEFDQISSESLRDIEYQASKAIARVSRFSEGFRPDVVNGLSRDVHYDSLIETTKEVVDELEKVRSAMHCIEELAASSIGMTVIQRNAVKDVISLEMVLKDLQDSLCGLSESLESHLRPSHLWQYWIRRIAPHQKQAAKELRGYRISIAGV